MIHCALTVALSATLAIGVVASSIPTDKLIVVASPSHNSELSDVLQSQSCLRVLRVLTGSRPPTPPVLDECKDELKDMLVDAIKYGDSECAIDLLRALPFLRAEPLENKHGKYGKYAIHLACDADRASIVDELTSDENERKFQVTVTQKFNQNAVDIVTTEFKKNAAKILIDNGAFDILQFSDRHLLEAARFNAACPVIENILKRYDSQRPLHELQMGNEARVKLIELALSYAVYSYRGTSSACLWPMMKDPKEEIVELVVAGDVERLKTRPQEALNGVDALKFTFLQAAAYSGSLSTIDWMLEIADNDQLKRLLVSSYPSSTALQLAVAQRNITVVERVVQAYRSVFGSIDGADVEGNTALHSAVSDNLAENVKYLLDAGANVNAVNAAGETPIYMSVKVTYDGIVDVAITQALLARSDCDLSIIPAGSKSLLELAVENGSRRKAEMIKQRIGDIVGIVPSFAVQRE